VWGAVAVRKTDHKYNWPDYRRAVFGIAGGVAWQLGRSRGPTSCYSAPAAATAITVACCNTIAWSLSLYYIHISSRRQQRRLATPFPPALFARKWSIDMFRPTRDSHSRSAHAVHRVTCFSMFNVLSYRRLLPAALLFNVSAYVGICKGNLKFLKGGLTVSRNLRQQETLEQCHFLNLLPISFIFWPTDSNLPNMKHANHTRQTRFRGVVLSCRTRKIDSDIWPFDPTSPNFTGIKKCKIWPQFLTPVTIILKWSNISEIQTNSESADDGYINYAFKIWENAGRRIFGHGPGNVVESPSLRSIKCMTRDYLSRVACCVI